MKKLLVSIFTLIFIISMSIITVNAATSGNVTLNLNKTTLKAGDTFVVTVSAEDSNTLNAVGYSTITVTNSEGTDVSSSFEVTKIEKVSDNVSGNMTEDSKTYYLMAAGDIQSSDIFAVTLKASDSISTGTYTININGLVVENKTNALGTDEEKTTDVGTKSVQITVTTDGTPAVDPVDDGDTGAGDGDTTGTKTPSTKDTTKSGNGSGSGKLASTDSDDEEEDDKELPQTGVEVVSIVAIAGLSACAIVSYISYKKYKNI